MGELKLRARASQNRKILALVKLKRVTGAKGQWNKGPATRRLLLTLPIAAPVTGKCCNPIAGTVRAEGDQISM